MIKHEINLNTWFKQNKDVLPHKFYELELVFGEDCDYENEIGRPIPENYSHNHQWDKCLDFNWWKSLLIIAIGKYL